MGRLPARLQFFPRNGFNKNYFKSFGSLQPCLSFDLQASLVFFFISEDRADPDDFPVLHNTVARNAEHSRPLFPSVHRLLLEHPVSNLEEIKGTGVRGMLTKGDVLTFLGKASNPLGTFKFGLSPIEEASKLAEKENDAVLLVRHLCTPTCLLNSIPILARLRRLSTERPYVDLSLIRCFKDLSKLAILHQASFSYKYWLPLDLMFFVRP